MDDQGGFFQRGVGVIHCLLIETSEGLVLVDAGWGMQDCLNPSPGVKQFMNLIGSPRRLEETAYVQIQSRGYDPSDVHHIFLSHMHLDHAGGLPDFPGATVHLLAEELAACLQPRTLMEKHAYKPEHWSHHPRWQTHPSHGDQWFGIRCAPRVNLGNTEIVLIPFAGHTRGHCAIAIRISNQWLMHCGDLYGYHRQADPAQPYAYPNGRVMERIITAGFQMPRRHWTTLRNLFQARGGCIRHFCSHDAQEFQAFQSE